VNAAEDQEAAEELLGPGGLYMLRSGDDVADRNDIETVAGLVREKIVFEDIGPGYKVALLGIEPWELPIPLVQENGGWRFDDESGREEILNRRIGRNELSTIATMHALVDAQREYASESRDGKARAFAQRVLSTEGRRDGLYWPVEEGEAESPLGPLVAEAFEEGYRRSDEGPFPYHGYIYRLLVAQGEHAPGGARSYIKDGALTGGFAVVAWPATYGNSGVMTFQVNHQGIVFEKDLGEGTAREVARIHAYDPDLSWTPTAE
jgi:hypothetical protein